jgi:cysteinyl-tRNA synthetase
MDDDLNSPVALAALWELVREVNSRLDDLGATPITEAEATAALDAFGRIDHVLGLLSLADRESSVADAELSAWVDERIAERQAARAARDFATADRIRDELASRNVLLEDTPTGPRWRIAT